jgi:hypothetical protein
VSPVGGSTDDGSRRRVRALGLSNAVAYIEALGGVSGGPVASGARGAELPRRGEAEAGAEGAGRCDRTTLEMMGLSPKIILGDSR